MFLKIKLATIVCQILLLQFINAKEDGEPKKRTLTVEYLLKKGYLTYNFASIHLIDKNIDDIENFTFGKYEVLRMINLGLNKLKSIRDGMFTTKDGSNLSALKELYLFENQIETIESGSFRNCINLELLDLAQNKLGQLNGDEFLGLDKLLNLNLEGNNLEEIMFKPFRNMKMLTHIYLKQNPLKLIEQNFLIKLLPADPFIDIEVDEIEVKFLDSGEDKNETKVLQTEEL